MNIIKLFRLSEIIEKLYHLIFINIFDKMRSTLVIFDTIKQYSTGLRKIWQFGNV